MGYSPEIKASVAELLLQSNAVAQVAVLPNGKGFLIRVWPPNGTAEFGGNNMTCLSVVLTFNAKGHTIVKHFDVRTEND